MIEFVLTKADVTHLSVVEDTTVVDKGNTPKRAYSITNTNSINAPGVCRLNS